MVAPRAGAWIETLNTRTEVGASLVAPRAGAWIETHNPFSHLCRNNKSRPVRARGLKPILGIANTVGNSVAPRAGAWIETVNEGNDVDCPPVSRPVRARGLKQYILLA